MNLLDIAIAKKMGGGGDEPTGTKEISITQNGVTTEDVKSYASAKITTSVPVGVFPSGTKQISSNGSYDVSNFASAAVNISPIIQSLSISENGTYSVPSGVDGYNPVTVNVSGGGGGGGDHDAEAGIIQRTISGSYYNSVATIVGNYAFTSCTSLTEARFPIASRVSASAFFSCTQLKKVVLDEANFVGSYAFNNCKALMSVVLLSSAVASLPYTTAFDYTPMSKSTYTGSFGSIYVPASLVDAYKSASNWSAYSARITAYTE